MNFAILKNNQTKTDTKGDICFQTPRNLNLHGSSLQHVRRSKFSLQCLATASSLLTFVKDLTSLL